MTKLRAEMKMNKELHSLEERRESLARMLASSNCEEKRKALKMELWSVKRRQDKLTILSREVI